jgi:diguanylate cyclase (GGDEF)-like protein
VTRNHIAAKLGSAFGILVAILIGIGSLGLSRMDQINAGLDGVLGRRWGKLHLAREALAYSSRNSRITMEVFLLNDKQEIQPLLSQRAENTQKISELVAKLEEQCDSPEEKQALAAVKDARAPYVTSYMRALHLLVDEKRPGAARAVMVQETTPALFRYHDAWNSFVQFQMDQMDKAAKESRVRYARIRSLTLALLFVAVIVACAIAVFATRKTTREIKTRVRAEHEIKELNAALEQRVAERTQELAIAEDQLRSSLAGLQEYTAEIEGVNELVELLQSCQTLEEAHSQVAKVLPRFFPAGALLMLNASLNLLDSVAAWGSAPARQGPFSPDSCWGLRRGRAHLVHAGNSGLRCGHAEQAGAATLCIPLIAQGESLGVLYIQDPDPSADPELLQRKQKFAVTLAEQVSLAFANLMLRETLKYQSVRDSLTGLFNRRHMEESLERELLRSARNGKPVAVLMIDIDHFKRFNDSFGHEAGDILLRELGSLLSSQIRGGDIACRYGGEEFLVIMMDASLRCAAERAETLREQARNLQIHHHGETLRKVTISIGVAAFPDHGSSAQELINRADRALYKAKTSGRDRVIVTHTGDPEAEAVREGSRQSEPAT